MILQLFQAFLQFVPSERNLYIFMMHLLQCRKLSSKFAIVFNRISTLIHSTSLLLKLRLQHSLFHSFVSSLLEIKVAQEVLLILKFLSHFHGVPYCYNFKESKILSSPIVYGLVEY